MQTLTNLDTSFLHLETKQTPLHVGGVLIFSAPSNEAMTFTRFRRHVISRLQTARVFRQRLYIPPALLDNPVWVEDADFHIDYHLTRRTIREPLSHKALENLGDTFFSKPLQRDRPLWEMMYVDTDKPTGGFAMLLKVHHSALDGVSAEAVITGLLDFTVKPRVLPTDTWQPEVLPKLTHVIRRRLGEIKHTPTHTNVLLKSTAALAGLLVKRTLTLRYRHLPSFFSAPKTTFNRPVTAERRYLGVQLSLSLVKAIKSSQQGMTVNDVVLAICAGATRRYLKECGDLPKESLVTMAPASRRTQDEKASAGNKVSAMLIKLATDVEHPVERLHRIHENAQLAKEYNRDIPIDSLMDLLPVAAPALTLSSFSALKMSRRLPPIFNMVITNVPGSPVPLYLDGALLQSMSGMVGVYDGVALTFVVMSYRDQLSIGITTTLEAVLKPELLAQYLQEAAVELAAAVLPAGWNAESTACEVIPLKPYAMPRANVVQMASSA